MAPAAWGADLRPACQAAARADSRYTTGNASEALVRMTAWETQVNTEIETGRLRDDPDRVRTIVSDIMAFAAQSDDPAEGKRTLKTFIADACR